MLKVFIPRFVFIVFASMIMYSLSYAENFDTKAQKHKSVTELNSSLNAVQY